MKLIMKAFLPIIIIALILSVIIGMTISTQIKNTTLDRAEHVTAEYISSEATKQLTADAFRNENYRNEVDIFDSFSEHITTHEIIKIKVFNLNHEIIYSTSKDNIGNKTDSQNYENALKGKITTLYKDPIEDQTNIDLKGYKQVMEIYVPVIYDGKVEGVIETYYKMDLTNDNIYYVTSNVLLVLGIFISLILLTTYLILTYIVIKPINALIVVADKITDGELDTKLPNAKSNDEISNLIASIEMLVASSKFRMKKGAEAKQEGEK